MNHQKAKQLIEKYLEAETTFEEEQQLRKYFRNEDIPEELQSFADQFRYSKKIKKNESGAGFDPLGKINFDTESSAPLSEEEKESTTANAEASDRKAVFAASMQSIKSRVLFDPEPGSNRKQFTRWSLRIAAGFILLLIGFAAGQFLNSDDEYASSKQVAKLQQELQQMKNVLTNTGDYQTASAGERLSAVNLSTQIPAENREVDQQITDILTHTMNNDKSVNVRMAAAEALFRFRQESGIKKALVNGLSEQEDPLMQITLIDMLVELKAKDAVSEMKKLLVDSDTQDIVRQRLRAGIAELKV